MVEQSVQKNAQTVEDFFETNPVLSQRKQNLIGIDRRKEIFNSIFQNFLNNNNIKHYSRNSSLGAVFAERFNRTIRELQKLVFETGDSKWIDLLSVITKQHNNRVHIFTKLTPKRASLKENEGLDFPNLLETRNKMKPKLNKFMISLELPIR